MGYNTQTMERQVGKGKTETHIVVLPQSISKPSAEYHVLYSMNYLLLSMYIIHIIESQVAYHWKQIGIKNQVYF